jgi:hypothetical protein
MDYSLLLIIIDKKNVDFNNDDEEIIKLFKEPCLARRIFNHEKSPFIYCIGIIDYLQKYNLKKRMEHRFKYLIHKDNCSAVDSKLYALRMQKFLSKYMLQTTTE